MGNVLFNFNTSPFPWLIWSGAALLCVTWRYLRASRIGTARIIEALAHANRQLGTHFPTDKNATHEFTVGPFAHPNRYCLIFDTHRKVAITYLGHCKVHDFDFIRTWELRWTEKSVGGRVFEVDPYLLIGTSDVRSPTLTVSLRSKREAHDWNQRLKRLLGG